MPELDARIPCQSDTRDRLRALKQGTERYDDVLQRLIDDAAGDND
jgi:hypothetical protein